MVLERTKKAPLISLGPRQFGSGSLLDCTREAAVMSAFSLDRRVRSGSFASWSRQQQVRQLYVDKMSVMFQGVV